MKKIIVHIGMHKTGSSSIQRSLNKYDDTRVRYVNLSNENHSMPIHTIFSENRYRKRYFRQRGMRPAEIDALADRFRHQLEKELELDREVLLISGEDISRIELAGVRRLKDFLLNYTDQIQILAYARDPIGFASSSFQQLVKFDTDTVEIPKPEYRSRFAKFIEVFGKDAVSIREFKRDNLFGRSVVKDVLNICGVTETDWPEQVVNESLSDSATRLLFNFNRHGPLSTGSDRIFEVRKRFVSLISRKFKGDNFRFPDEVFSRDTVDMDDLEWLKENAGIDFTVMIPNTPAPLSLQEVEAQIEKIGSKESRKLSLMLDRRAIRCRETAVPREKMAFLFYDELAREWKPKKANRRASKSNDD